MRRVDSEGDTQSRRDRKRGVARAGASPSRSRLRRVSLEILENRELLSTLPSPVTTLQSFVGSSDTSGQGNSSSPSVAVDPLNPNKLVAAWTTYDPAHKLDGTNGQVTTYAQAAYSIDGGQSWTPLLSGFSAVNLQDDFSVAPSTTAPQPHFAQTTDATVAIGPDETAYLLTSSHAGTSGVIDLQRWDFSGNVPAARAFARNAFDTTFESTLLNPIYRWQGGDQAVTPTLAVDTSLVDPTVANSARYAGNVYVAWQTIDSAPQNVTVFNPQAIKLVASSDGGQDFTFQNYLNGGTFPSHNAGNRYTSPRLVVSAGGGGATAGQVAIVYDDAGPGAAPAVAPFFDLIDSQTVTSGSAVAQVASPGGPISNAGTLATSFTFQVGISDTKFTSLQNLSLSLSLSYPALGDTSAVLTSPDGVSVTLWNNATDSTGAATNFPGTITGANMGASAEHGTATNASYYIGTTLDSTAFRPLSGDTTVAAPYTGRFRPFGNLTSPFLGRQPVGPNGTPGLNGTWTLTITPSRVQTVTPPAAPLQLVGASLDFTSGLVANAAKPVGTSYLNSGASTFTDGVQGVPVFANPVIASDNTMGANGAHKGRLYIAYTNDDYVAATGAYTDSTFINLAYSDNGGQNWTNAGIVNDDNGLTDGFSTGGYSQPNLLGTNVLRFLDPKANVRPKLDPEVAVDPSTGTLVVSFLDARHDASRVRVATYVAASDDGGQTFAPETYANPSQFAVDAITRQAVNLGPIPDNQSAGNGGREATFGYGQRQGLAVANGRIIPVWSSNRDAGSNLRNNLKSYLNIESAVMTYAAGPRVIASTQGPVGEPGSPINQRRAADGSPIAETIVLTFDRPVDPASFPSDAGNAIGTSPIQVFYNNPSGTAAPVPLRVLSVTPGAGNTVYTITFDPAGHGIGSYTYTLNPSVRGLNPYRISPTTTATGSLLDQNADGVPGGAGDAYTVGAGAGQLPLIVPGPHVVSTTVVDTNNVASTGADNLIKNGSVGAIGVTFDRDIRADSFTSDQVLAITGPTGPISGPQRFTSTATSKAYPFNGGVQAIPKAAAAGGTPTRLVAVVPISGTNLNVSSLTVRVNITDPNDQSLSLTLVAPDGTQVPLVAAGTAAGANFTETTFSDSPPANGLPATPIAGGQAPYGLTYKPSSPLSALAGKNLDGNWSLIVADSTTTGAAGRLNSWSLGVTPQVPEGTGTVLNSTLSIPYVDDSFTIGHLAVQLNLTAARDGDLAVDLISPSGTIISLLYGVGGSGQNFANTTFDQSATIPIASGVAPFSLTYRPAGDLTTLDGQSIRGTWTLRVRDPNPNGLTATLNSWSLIATPQITVSPSSGVARSFTIGFPTQRLSGNYTATLGTGIRSVAADPSSPGVGAAVDTNLNAGVDALKGVSNGVTTPSTYAATAVPVAIPAGPGGTLTALISVPDNFTVQGDAVGGPAGLVVRLDVSYANDPDLTVTLTSPSGRTITLFSGVGNGAVNANFTNTVLSDVTSPLSPITSAPAPFFGTFNPTTPLATFAGDASGGAWKLTISNAGTTAAVGTLNSWSLTFQRPQPGTGLGERVADQKTVGFRLFNIAPTDPLSNNSWTAVGPAGILAPDTTKLSGPVSVVAFDPSDPSRNTAFVGASSGGVWKTTDFLTTAASGPTYVPLTDFGPNYSLDIGGIAVFGRNGDPGQSIVFAGTGNGQTSYGAGGNATRGVGILRSLDGGRSWTLLDSTTNVDASGNPLPINSPLRDHALVGTTTYKVVVDPTPASTGVIVYAALGGAGGGLWRSVDGGAHWVNLSAGVIPQVGGQNAAATDVLLDPASASSSTGTLDILYAAFQGVGVFLSGNRGQSLSLLAGTNNATNLIQNSQFLPSPPLRVNNPASPNGAFGRIVLAKPALTNNAAQNILYQDWLYAAVENADGTFRGLYETKDRGENWTRVSIASVPTPANSSAVTQALPTNDNAQANNFDVTNGATSRVHNGNYAFSLTVDPSNPDAVYLGGTTDYQTSGLIRVDLSGIYDAHAFVPFADDRNDGGALRRDATGRVDVNAVNFPDPAYIGSNFSGFFDPNYYVNLRHSPTNPFDLNSTLFVYNSNGFINDGTGVTWKPVDQIYGSPLGGSTNIHQLLTVVDPLTGLTRLVVADDQGVFTGLYDASGVLSTAGIGTAASVNGSRNGNLQDAQLYYGAAQPSSLAAAAAGALFYGSGIGTTDAQSDSNLLSDGNLTWVGKGTQYGNIQNTINSYDRIGSGIATDPTGGTTVSNPIGTGPSSYEYDQPFLGGDTTNFFRVNQSGQTTGLVNNYTVDFPLVSPVYNGVTPLGNFAVNPIDGSQILISTARGDLYETTNKGVQWLRIGTGIADFDGTYAPAVTYGAPDPKAPNGLGNLNNFIYAGTVGGHVYLTQTGGGPWTSISAGLDGSSVVAIYTKHDRGSHEAYAVTLRGVYYMADSVASTANPTPTWVNITGNLSQVQHNPFNDPTLGESASAGFNGGGQLGGFRSIVADYRYSIPDASGNGQFHPVLYVAGYGGVFRSLDNGQTWSAFPNTSFDSAPADGGYLPNVEVTSLTLNLGAINPATGHAGQVTGDPEVLLASTFGRGEFAIRLAPDVFPTVGLDPTLPAPGGSATGTLNGNPLTNQVHPFIAGTSEISNFGNNVTITLIDEATGLAIGTGTTDTFGHFSVQVGSLANDPSFGADGVKTIGVQATDSSGAEGNVTLFTYALKTTVPPPAPTALTLDPSTNSGLVPAANITHFTHPLFDVTGVLPNDYLELFRSIGSSTPILVGTAAVGATQVRDTTGVPADGVYLYKAAQVSAVGDVSNFSPTITVTISTAIPPAPTILLVDADDSGLPGHPNVTNVRSPRFSGMAAYNAGTNFPLDILAVTNGNNAGGIVQARAYPSANGTYLAQILGPIADGTYTLVARTTNLAGNVSYSAPLTITIKATGPVIAPALALLPADDTGIKGDGVTANHSPRFTGVADRGATVNLYALVNGQLSGVQATATASTINGSFTFSLPFNLTDGTTQLVARAVDIANNPGPLGAPFSLRIVTVAGDYLGTGAAQLAVFNPSSQVYSVQGVGSTQVDTTSGRDVPVQHDFNGDGKVDLVAYRYNTAEYHGQLSNGSAINQQFGPGGSGLPASGTFGTTGTFIYGSYNPNIATWYLALPQPGGEVVRFGVPNVDIPTPAAFDGGGVAEIAYFRPNSTVATDRDSFTVATSVVNNQVVGLYRVSFTNSFISRLGFVYKAGDLPAPADYDGIGKDEFAIYRPSTGQFFILRTPNLNVPTTWTLRTVTPNLPGGPNANDVPASLDYDGDGKADPTVYRPSSSTFYLVHSSTGIQENLQFGTPGGSIAAAGPLLYRLTALKGAYATTGGYPASVGAAAATNALATGGVVQARSIAPAASSAVPSPAAVASAIVIGTTTATPSPAPTPTASGPKSQVVVGASTPKAFIPVVAPSRPGTAHAKAAKARKPAKALVVDSRPQAAPAAVKAHASKAPAAPARHHPAVALAMQKVVNARKGGHQG